MMDLVSDSIVLTRRNLIRLRRTPQLLVFSTIQPVMFTLLFVYVFGGSIPTPGFDSYEDYLIPGIMVQTSVFGATATAVGLAEDLAGGMIDRFRSLPMSPAGVLVGRTVADCVRNSLVVTLVVIVGLIVGFRANGGVIGVAAAMLLVVAFGFAWSWLFALVGLMVKTPETAQVASFLPVFPLVFASSVFVRTETMPSWLEWIAEHQPVTRVTDAVRALAQGMDASADVIASLAWIAAMVAVFSTIAVLRFRRTE